MDPSEREEQITNEIFDKIAQADQVDNGTSFVSKVFFILVEEIAKIKTELEYMNITLDMLQDKDGADGK